MPIVQEQKELKQMALSLVQKKFTVSYFDKNRPSLNF
jgi:hypothetical protein